jgi:hypothetical protein
LKEGDAEMYQFSRSIYREIAAAVIEDEGDPTGCRNKQLVLDACEDVIRRLATDRRYFARPARTLFNDVRIHFSLADQRRVWNVIDANIKLAHEFLDRMPDEALLFDVQRECRAHTRKGTPCQREPLPGRDYCPSHKHLEETFDGPEIPIEFEQIESIEEVHAPA